MQVANSPRLCFRPSILGTAWFFAVSCCAFTSALWGAQGDIIRLPGTGVKNNTGLRLTVNAQWVNASGYRDVRVQVTPLGGPSPVDRRLRVELSPIDHAGDELHSVTAQDIDLPQGSNGVTAHILVPQNEEWPWLRIDTYENGRLLRELSARQALNNTAHEDWSEALPAILIVDAHAPEAEVRQAIVDRARTNPGNIQGSGKLHNFSALLQIANPSSAGASSVQLTDPGLLLLASMQSRIDILPPAELPPKWQGLSSFDLIFISLRDLTAMSQNNKPQFAALTNWLGAGGNLVVTEVGANFANLSPLEKLLALPEGENNARHVDWITPSAVGFDDLTWQESLAERVRLREREFGEGTAEDEELAEAEEKPLNVADAFGGGTSGTFLLRPKAMGMLVVFAGDPFPASTVEWSWMLNSIGRERHMWFLRNGLSRQRPNNEFWDFLVPNTGRAPVGAFLVLISLFAIVIGPVNYFVLARQRRLYLLLVTIPLGAAVVTFGLIAWAVFSDGFGTRLRTRDYTFIDQRDKQAVNWSRQSYYAGMAPSRGLVFPEDTAIYLLEHYPQTSDGGVNLRRRMLWDEGQRLQSGYLSSRVTFQLITVRTRQTNLELKVTSPAGKPPSVENRLGANIELLLLRDQNGDYFWGENIRSSASKSLRPADLSEARTRIAKALSVNAPAKPEGFDVDTYTRPWRRGWYGWYSIDRSMEPPSVTHNLMETRLRTFEMANANQLLRPKSYFAITSNSPELPIGVPGARQEAGLHVIEGVY